MNRQAAVGALNERINREGREWQNGHVGRNLTTHSTGRAISLPVIENLSHHHVDCAPVNSGVGRLPIGLSAKLNYTKLEIYFLER